MLTTPARISDRRLTAGITCIHVECNDGFGGVTNGSTGALLRRAAEIVDQMDGIAVLIDTCFESDDSAATLKLYFEPLR